MTGTIKSLGAGSSSGFIMAENGLNVCFYSSALLAYDANTLAVGQLVSFDLDGGRFPKALNVCVQRSRQATSVEDKRLESTRLRYLGFEQQGSLRYYQFERNAPGEERRAFTVITDMALFAKHHVGIQEGPALCLHLLAAELEVVDSPVRTRCQCSLSDREMQAYLASRPVPRAKRGPKRTFHATGAA